MDRGAWWATVHRVAKDSDLTEWLNNDNNKQGKTGRKVRRLEHCWCRKQDQRAHYICAPHTLGSITPQGPLHLVTLLLFISFPTGRLSSFLFSPLLFFFNFILFLNFTIFYWFCQILKWIHHRYTCVPHPELSSLLPPHTIPLGRPSAPAPSIQYHALNLDWRLVSYMILYMFQWIFFTMLILSGLETTVMVILSPKLFSLKTWVTFDLSCALSPHNGVLPSLADTVSAMVMSPEHVPCWGLLPHHPYVGSHYFPTIY